MLSKQEIIQYENELKIFKAVNGENKKYTINNVNYMRSSLAKDVIKNQGISRAKLREFVSKEGIDYEYWIK